MKRSAPEVMSTPTVPSRTPAATVATPFSAPPLLTTEAATSPSSITAKYSVGPKDSAKRASAGDSSTITTMPIMPPPKDATAVMKRATPARPWRAMGCPSMQVIEDDGVPGMLRRIDAIEPPYSAP